MCGGFSCSKNTLVALNLMYIVVSFILIGVAVTGRTSNSVDSLPIIGGITACGIFLLIISVVGLVGAIKHHQVSLFFYMVILFLIFIIQFSVSVAALSMTKDNEIDLVRQMWNSASNETKFSAEKLLGCCGLDDPASGVKCDAVAQYLNRNETTLPSCNVYIQDKVDRAFNGAGTVGLIFSLTEIVGFVIAYRYRHMMDPLGLGPAGAGFSTPH